MSFFFEKHQPCCDLFGVIAAVGAMCLSLLAAILVVSRREEVHECISGLGDGAGALHGLMWTSVVIYGWILIVNLLSTGVLLLSHFTCQKLEENKVVHFLTSSRSLCVWLTLTLMTFSTQLLRLGFAMSLQGVLAFLAVVCNMGPGVVYLAQEMIYTMGNATSGTQSNFNPYTKVMPYGEHVAFMPYLQIETMTTRFDILRYCKMTDNGKDGTGTWVVVGCFLSVISQALMALALNGEKERVSVHEEQEFQSALAELVEEGAHMVEEGAHMLGEGAHMLGGFLVHPTQAVHAVAGAFHRGGDRLHGFRDRVMGDGHPVSHMVDRMNHAADHMRDNVTRFAGHAAVDMAVAANHHRH